MASTDRIQGLSGDLAIKAPCRVATTAAITLTDLQTIDGVTLVSGDRVLVKDQSTTTENGIYTAGTGDWVRALDFDGPNDVVNGTQVLITDGSLSADLFYTVSATNPVTPGSTAITFSSSATAASSAAAAAASAAEAALSASEVAGYVAPVTSTSTTSVAIGTGDKAFTIETGKPWVPGHPVKIAQTSDPVTNYMVGTVKSYNATTGAMVVTVAAVGGSGTIAAWTLSLQPSSTGAGSFTTLSSSSTTVLNGTPIPASKTLAALETAQSFSAKQTFGTTVKFDEIIERVTITASAPTGTFDCLTQAVQYFTGSATANWTQNFRGDGSTTLNSQLAVGEAITVTVLTTQGVTPYYPSAHQVDGTATGVTVKWLSATPTAGDASCINAYTYTIVKTADATFTVLASKSKYA